ncbi:hypothetical protein DUNSADRAFT_16099, partial [Dunaliella salina]
MQLEGLTTQGAWSDPYKDMLAWPRARENTRRGGARAQQQVGPAAFIMPKGLRTFQKATIRAWRVRKL